MDELIEIKKAALERFDELNKFKDDGIWVLPCNYTDTIEIFYGDVKDMGKFTITPERYEVGGYMSRDIREYDPQINELVTLFINNKKEFIKDFDKKDLHLVEDLVDIRVSYDATRGNDIFISISQCFGFGSPYEPEISTGG
jgi:hypothetical protein